MNELNKNDPSISFEIQNSASPNEKDGLKEDKIDLYEQYKKYKWKEPEKLRNGPFGDESRKCRDCLCCIIFIIFLIAYLITSLVGFVFGKPKKILYSYDEDGHACGYDDGYENHSMLYSIT